MNVDFNDHSLRAPSQEEYDVAEYVAEIIISICNRKRFEYDEETTLDVYTTQCSDAHYDNEEEPAESSESESGSDYELEDHVKKEPAELSKYSLEFMQSLVEYAYEENVSGQRRRT